MPVMKKLDVTPTFARGPQNSRTFSIDSDEARNLIHAVGHQVTPWEPLRAGMWALLNFFYPADDLKRDKTLEYYRQREWRIACCFAIHGKEVLHVPTPCQKKRLLEIDPDFFGRKLQTDLETGDALSYALIHPGLNGRTLIEMVRRIFVPVDAVDRATDLLASVPNAPQVVSMGKL